ncbi:MAG: hypothetical protein GY713_05560 [Actinomycetia bacterium]|nr:hypothetical protein [Actinomycetes bacterium]
MADDGPVGRLIRQGFRKGLDRDSNLLVAASSVLWVFRFASRISRPRDEVLYSSRLKPGRVLSVSGELFEFGNAPDASDDRALLDVPDRPLKRRERKRQKKAVKAATPPRRVQRKAARQAEKEAEQARRAAAKTQRKAAQRAHKRKQKVERKAQRRAERAIRRNQRRASNAG